jgi:hypothetical protein
MYDDRGGGVAGSEREGDHEATFSTRACDVRTGDTLMAEVDGTF